jgi:hypothetical protein
MLTELYRKIRSIFFGKCKNVCKTATTFSVCCLRYTFSFFEFQSANRVGQHELSQLMILSPKLRRLHSMITPSERAYLYWYGRHIFSGKGDIVDLGCWLGSTSISLAMGLERNNHAKFNRLIHSYDEFVWRSYMDNGARGTNLEGKYKPGDSFLDEFERRTYPWRHYIKAWPGDLAKVGWHGGTIEFLLIDAMKSWEAASGVVRTFFPALMPGGSIIMHQDFAHWYTAWIHPIHYRLRDYFEPLYDVPSSGSMVFRLIKPLPSDVLKQEWSQVQFSNQDIESAFAYSLDMVSGEKRPNVAAAKVMYFIHAGELERAKQEIAHARSRGYSFDSDLSIVEQRLNEEVARQRQRLDKQ